MNDGLPQAGQSPRVPAQAQARTESTVRIISLPDALTQNARGQRLDGEVVQQNRDGSTRIRTPQGDVDVDIRGRQPQTGQRVELDLPAGRPPRQAVIRPAPDTPDIPQPQNTRGEQQAVQSQIARTQVRADVAVQNVRNDQARTLTDTSARPQGTQAQAQPQIQTPAAGRQAPPAPQPLPLPSQSQIQPQPATPLPQGAAVRLTPISTAQVQQFLTQLAPTLQIVPASVQSSAFSALQSVQSVISQNIQTLLTTASPQAQPPGQSIRQSTGQPQIQPSVPAPTAPLLTTQQLSQPQSLPQFQIIPQTSNAIPAGQTTFQPNSLQITAPFQTPQSAPIQTPQLIQTPALLPGNTGSIPAASPGNTNPFSVPIPFDVRLSSFGQNAQVTLVPPSSSPGAQQATQALSLPAQTVLPQSISNPSAQAGQIVGQVTGFTPQNLPILSFQFSFNSLPQSFILQYQASNLSLGTQLILQPGALPSASSAPATPGQITGAPQSTLAQIPQGLLMFGNQFPPLLMEESYQALLQAAPALAQSLGNALPSPANPSQLGAAALLFLTAVRSGDLSSWMGDKKLEALQRLGQTGLLSRLTASDGAGAPRMSADISTPTGEWRAVPLPMFWDGEIQRVNLFVRGEGQNADEDAQSEKLQTRFIFDLTMSRMGDVQIDGLIREDRLDMVVRTQNPLSAPMQQTLKQLYTKALDSESLRGELGFQGDPRQWVNILKNEQQLGMDA